MVLRPDVWQLESVGVTQVEERIYRLVLAHPGSSVPELAQLAGLSRTQTPRVLGALEAKGLVRRSPSRVPRFVGVPPRAAVEVLILHRQEELERTRIAAERLQEELERARPALAPIDQVEVVTEAWVRDERYLEILRSVQRDFIGLGRGAAAGMHTELKPGVRYRGIYESSALEQPGQLEVLRQFVAAGESVRHLHGLPAELVIADGSVGILPLRADDPEAGILIVRSEPLLASLLMLFETLWNVALPLDVGVGVSGEGGPGERERSILQMLAAGAKDESIARALDLSRVTIARTVERLMKELGARTRFQAGLLAGKRGWV